MMREHPEAYSAKANVQLSVTTLRDQIAAPARTILLVLLAAAGGRVRHRVLERRQPDPGALGAPRRRAGRARRARRRPRRAPAHAAGREPGALRRRRRAGRAAGAAVRRRGRRLCRALLGPRARGHRRCERALGRRRPGDGRGRAARLRPAPAVAARAGRPRPGERQRPDHAGHQPPPAGVRDDADCVLVRAARRRGHAPRHARRPADGEHRLRHAAGAGVRHPDVSDGPRRARRRSTSIRKRRGASASCRASRASRWEASCPGAMPAASVPASSSPSRATRPRTAKRTRARGCASSRLASSPCSASRCSPAATSPTTTAAAASPWRSSARASRSGCSRTATR